VFPPRGAVGSHHEAEHLTGAYAFDDLRDDAARVVALHGNAAQRPHDGSAPAGEQARLAEPADRDPEPPRDREHEDEVPVRGVRAPMSTVGRVGAGSVLSVQRLHSQYAREETADHVRTVRGGIFRSGRMPSAPCLDFAHSLTLDSTLVDALGAKTAGSSSAPSVTGRWALLNHYPRRYARRGELTPIASLPLGEQVTIVAEVRSVSSRPMKQRSGSIVEVVISDGVGAHPHLLQPEVARGSAAVGRQGCSRARSASSRDTSSWPTPTTALRRRGRRAAERRGAAAHADPDLPATSTVASWQVQKAVASVAGPPRTLPDPFRRPCGRRLRRLAPIASTTSTRCGASRRAESFEQRRRRATNAAHARGVHPADRAPPAARDGAGHGGDRAPAGELLHVFDARLPFTRTADQDAVGTQIAADLEGPGR
jgi:ATP-dependent DNA helicase RecG